MLVNEHTRVAVGDAGYRSIPLHKKVRRAFGTFILTPPHYKQQKQLMSEGQRKLLRRRPKVGTVFDYLKQHLHLQTSFPRSVQGYALHYTRILLGYQLLMVGWGISRFRSLEGTYLHHATKSALTALFSFLWCCCWLRFNQHAHSLLKRHGKLYNLIVL